MKIDSWDEVLQPIYTNLITNSTL
uniref:Uncharacterized protein n=1 Tax=Arundo donax TaxID=35708 RepID=A0A0A9A4U7_ARUDO